LNLGPVIYVVDDDPAVSRALASAGELLGVPVAAFASAADFLREFDRTRPACLVLDIKMPTMTGLELQRYLADESISLPIIMISGHADVRIAVEVMARGAVTLLEKPFRLDELLAHLRRALEIDVARRDSETRHSQVESQFRMLTAKEREVLELVAAGKSNKQIAAQLQLSIRAVEDRRARVFKKLHVGSVAELVLMASQRTTKQQPP
jgi:FixJ family two-component response regulator